MGEVREDAGGRSRGLRMPLFGFCSCCCFVRLAAVAEVGETIEAVVCGVKGVSAGGGGFSVVSATNLGFEGNPTGRALVGTYPPPSSLPVQSFANKGAAVELVVR